MKILVLLLSLLYGVSGVSGNNTNYKPIHNYESILGIKTDDQDRFEKICSQYDYRSKYRKTQAGQCAFKASKSQCKSVFGSSLYRTKYGSRCIVNNEQLDVAQWTCSFNPVACPNQFQNGFEEKACSGKDHQDYANASCTLPKGSQEAKDWENLKSFVSYVQQKVNKDHQCGSFKTIALAGMELLSNKAFECDDARKRCDIYCSKRTCESLYDKKTEDLFQTYALLTQNAHGNCAKQIDAVPPYPIKRDTIEDWAKGKAGIQQADIHRMVGEFYNARNNYSDDSGRIIVAEVQKKPFSEGTQQPEAPKNKVTEQNKFNANTNYVKDTFNKLDQKMADRLNQGKATKEDRKPNNAIASVSNDNSLPNKKKNNKYLVASSNDSFLTKKDIFKTVSNAYYKMCQTDSCYGIVKK